MNEKDYRERKHRKEDDIKYRVSKNISNILTPILLIVIVAAGKILLSNDKTLVVISGDIHEIHSKINMTHKNIDYKIGLISVQLNVLRQRLLYLERANTTQLNTAHYNKPVKFMEKANVEY